MNRLQKIKAIQDIISGVPAKFALNPNKYAILYKNHDEGFYYSKNGGRVTANEKDKFLPDAIVFENVSKQFRF